MRLFDYHSTKLEFKVKDSDNLYQTVCLLWLRVDFLITIPQTKGFINETLHELVKWGTILRVWELFWTELGVTILQLRSVHVPRGN